MYPRVRPFTWAARAVSFLGFCALSLTGEVGPGYLTAAWLTWCGSLALDRDPQKQEPLRRWETTAVLILVAAFVVDFFLLHATVFLAVTHFLILFQIFKLLGLKERKDCLQIFLVGFFQILGACTLSVDA